MSAILKTSGSMLNLPALTTDVEQGKRDMDEYGLCVHRDFITPEQVKRLKERLVEQAEQEREYGVALLSGGSRSSGTWYGHPEPGHEPGWQGIPALYNKGGEFIELLSHPLYAEYAKHVFRGNSFHLSAMTGLIVRRGAEPMVIHVDQQFMPYTEVPTYLNAMLCLTEFEEVMGATRVVPKSHLGPYPKQAFDAKRGAYNPEPIDTVAVEAPAGSVIFFESRTWHQSGTSHSDKTRYSLTTLWQQSWVKPMDCIVENLHEEVYRSLSQAQLEMLGFKAEPSGRIEARSAGSRQNTNRKTPYVPELRCGGNARPVALDDMGEMKSAADVAKGMGLKIDGSASR
jgi:ectoine hydroxylase-related dioxygenase (phytanoyl-CoA dioxygenase family)